MGSTFSSLPIKKICSRIGSGGTPSRKKAHYFSEDDSGYLWVKSKELLECGIFDTEEKITESGLANSSAKIYPENTVLVAMYGVNAGQLGWLEKPATLNQAIAALVVDPKKAYWKYVFYALTARRKALIGLSRGGAQSNLNKEIIEDFEIPLPETLDEQIRIGDALAALDAKIANNLDRIGLLEEAIQLVFNEWFIHYRFPKAEHHRFIDSNTEYGSVPSDWALVRIGDRFKITLGGTPSRKKKDFWTNGSIPWINSGEVNLSRIIEATELITPEALRDSATKLLEKRTTVLAITGATLGQVSLTEIECCANQSVIGIYDTDGLHNEYILMRIKREIGRIIALAGGGAQQHINKEVIEDKMILIPDGGTAQAFRKIVLPMFDLIANLLFSNKHLVDIRARLVPQLISGTKKIT